MYFGYINIASQWKFGDRVKVTKIMIMIKHLETQKIEEGELDIEDVEKKLIEDRHYTSTNRWVPTKEIKNGYVINSIKPEVMWIPETWGMENFSMMGLASKQNTFSKIGSSIINIYSRSPSLIAMGASTIDIISNGRLILGLGTSSVPIVEDFHGNSFESPVQRMKEYVEIIRMALRGQKINYSGKIFSLKDFSLLTKPVRKEIPIYLAAINQKMVEMTWDIADGVIFYLRPKNEMKNTISIMQKRKKIDTTLQIITCIHEDDEKARNRAKKTLSFYIAVGKIYREFLQSTGYSQDVQKIYEEYTKTGLDKLQELIPEKMLDDLCIAGTPDTAIKKFFNENEDIPAIVYDMDEINYRLASGTVGIQHATNEIIEESELPMMLIVYAVIFLLVFGTYMDWRATICCTVPLTFATMLGYAFMDIMQIGLKVSTLPVMVLAVGIGVDYAFYIVILIFHLIFNYFTLVNILVKLLINPFVIKTNT